ncbi:HPr family phosphocarrier protein [Tuwongella immobilis]|uniref:HPr family phosphocarrier protein n=1 Tax=Tuwongella immobilis TaxID=692036 RepID=UPI0013A6F9A1|nr:HPr family phosphocarrier protein [Tuwongella immobilis]
MASIPNASIRMGEMGGLGGMVLDTPTISRIGYRERVVMNDNPFSASMFGSPSEFPHSDGSTGSPSFRQAVRVGNPQGLHMRPAAAFAQMARQFEASVTVWRHDRSVNGKSWLDLLLLTAEPGDELIVEVSGSDAAVALPALAELLASEGAMEDLPSTLDSSEST